MSLRPQLHFVVICLLLDAMGIGLIIPVLPRLIGELTPSAHAQTLWYGGIMLAYGLMYFLSAPFLGALSDRYGRKPLLLGGMFGLGVTFIVPAVSSSLTLILISRLIGGLTSANMTVAQAYVADILPAQERSRAFGKLGAAFSVGLILGPAMGGVLGHVDTRLPFFTASLLSLANMAYGYFVLPESLPVAARKPFQWRSANPVRGIARLMRSSALQPMIVMLGLASLATGLMNSSWALYTEYRYAFTPLHIGLSVFWLGLCLAFVQAVALPRWTQHVAPLFLLRRAVFVSAVGLLGIGLAPWPAVAVTMCCVYSVSGILLPLVGSSVSASVSAQEQGATMGAVNSVVSLCTALGPLLATPLLHVTHDADGGFLAGAPYFVAALLFALALLTLKTKQPTKR